MKEWGEMIRGVWVEERGGWVGGGRGSEVRLALDLDLSEGELRMIVSLTLSSLAILPGSTTNRDGRR